MGVGSAIRDITSFVRLNMVTKAVDAQIGLMTGKRPLQQTTGADISQVNIAACRNAKVKASVGNIVAAKSAMTLAGTFLSVIRDKLENMLGIAELAQNQDLVPAELASLQNQFKVLSTDVATAVAAFEISGTNVWGAAYELEVPINGNDVSFALIQLDVGNTGTANLSMADAELAFNVDGATSADALASANVVRGYLGLIAAQESVVAGHLSAMDGYIANMQEKIGQNSAIGDEFGGYDLDDASDFMADVLEQAQGSGFGQMLGAGIRDTAMQVAARLVR